jgi:hypothetical protein
LLLRTGGAHLNLRVGSFPSSAQACLAQLIPQLPTTSCHVNEDPTEKRLLTLILSCASDVRRCLESYMFDPAFNQKIKQWHSTCDKYIRSSMTIPIEPTITTTYDFGACTRLQQSCLSADYETNLCSNKYLPTSSLSYASCACQPPVYSLFSECQYNGNISCKQATGVESNIIGYSVCSYFWPGSVN